MGAPLPYAQSRPLKIEEVHLDAPGPGEILVKMKAAGLCHSDLSQVAGLRKRTVPVVMGHEGAGIVRDVGRGVKADMVVGIDLLSFNLHEGQTLLKGRSKVGVKVYDMTKGGEPVYESAPKEIAWPENGARHVTENEAQFRTNFTYMLADRIARDFYSVELMENFSEDARHLAN